MDDSNVKYPHVESDKGHNYYYCPNCRAFQYPTKDDLDGTISTCRYCGQKINYERYIAKPVPDEESRKEFTWH